MDSIRDLFVDIDIDVDDGPLAELDRRIDAVVAALSGINTRQLDKLENHVEDVADGFDDLDRHIDDVDDGLDDLDSDNLRDIEKNVDSADNAFSKMNVTILAFGAALAGIAFDKLKDFAMESIEAAANAKALNAQFEQVFEGMEDTATAGLNRIAEETQILPNRLKGTFVQMSAFAKTTGADTATALKITERATMAAADSAAFYDRSIEDVAANLQSFLKGKVVAPH